MAEENPAHTLAQLLDEFAIEHLIETSSHLDALRYRLGRDGLSMDEWNALISASSELRLAAKR